MHSFGQVSLHRYCPLCDAIVILPIYTSTFYDGTCKYSITGVTWTFASFLVLGVMGMLMIMFRSSWLPTVHVDAKFYLEEPVEGVEVEYEPHQSGSWVEGTRMRTYLMTSKKFLTTLGLRFPVYRYLLR